MTTLPLAADAISATDLTVRKARIGDIHPILHLINGYAAQGIAGSFLVKIVGSYSNIVGLPLYETVTLLGGEGYPIHFGWLNAVS